VRAAPMSANRGKNKELNGESSSTLQHVEDGGNEVVGDALLRDLEEHFTSKLEIVDAPKESRSVSKDASEQFQALRDERAFFLKSLDGAFQRQLLAQEKLLLRYIGETVLVQSGAEEVDGEENQGGNAPAALAQVSIVAEPPPEPPPTASKVAAGWDLPSMPQDANPLLDMEIAKPATIEEEEPASPTTSPKSFKLHELLSKSKSKVTLEWSLGDEERQQYLHLGKNSFQKTLYSHMVALMDWWMSLAEPPRKGPLSSIVQGKCFESVSAAVIVLNAGFMTVTTNHSVTHLSDDLPPWIMAGELFFLCFYSIELTMKLCAHRIYFFCNQEMNWNLFDFALVLFTLVDFVMTLFSDGPGLNLSFMRLLRFVRVAKILRVVRVMRVFTELRLMLQSVMGSFYSLFWAFVMLIFIFYIFGLIFVQGVASHLLLNADDLTLAQREGLIGRFGSVEVAMLSLFKAISGGADWEIFYDNPGEDPLIASIGMFYLLLYVFFIFFIQVALLNILTGIFVENAIKLAQPDRDSLAWQQRKQEAAAAKDMVDIFTQLDTDGSGTVSRKEFGEHIQSGKLKSYLMLLGLDIRDAESFFDMMANLNTGDDEVDIEEFIQGCQRLKGYATSVDVQSLMFETKRLHKDLTSLENVCSANFPKMRGKGRAAAQKWVQKSQASKGKEEGQYETLV